MFWYLMGAMLGIVWVRILGLFGLMFDFFWDHFGFPRSEAIFGNLAFWDSMLGALGLRF